MCNSLLKSQDYYCTDSDFGDDTMTKKELWQIFMKTGRVSDFLNYKNASDDEADTELTEEFAEEFINNYDNDFPAAEEYKNDYRD